jgi:protein CWC15
MTTAARPTWDTAKGGGGRGEKSLGALSKQYSSRDLPSHLKLKYRQSGQNTSDDLKNKDFKRDLEDRERVAAQEREVKRGRSSQSSSGLASKKLRPEAITANIDADDRDEDVEEDDEDSDDSDEDDTAELLAELNRIKRERAQEEAKKEADKKAHEERIRMENILSGNPLLGSNKTEFKVKRRWDDDVVFKNCARNEPDKEGKPFINDTIRSEFHKKFMEKYIK